LNIKTYKFLALILLAAVVLFLPFYGCRKQATETSTQEAETIEETEAEEVTEQDPQPDPIPQEIQDLVDEADSLYHQGLYSEANKAYRSAIMEVEKWDTEDKQVLLSELNDKYEETKQVVDMARMHHGNAMKLQYEKRFEEAIEELNMALEVYPKYQPAIDALATLKAMEGLQ